MHPLRPTLLLMWCGLLAVPATGQTPRPLTRSQAGDEALARSPRLRLAGSDTARAVAALRTASLFPDPSLSLAWSRSAPSYHASLELPLDLPWLRSSRINAATFGQAGSRWRFAFERAATQLEADTAYTRALAAREQWRLSARNADATDSLRGIAEQRRDAGDASELEVQLAVIVAGQQRNRAVADSLAYDDARLALQAALGIADGAIVVEPADSFLPPPPFVAPAAGTPLLVAAAEADVAAAAAGALFARRSALGAPSLTAGFERGDPDMPGTLPTVGISLPLPLVNRNRGGVATAEAERQRAEATAAAVRVESGNALARAIRAERIAMTLVARDAALLQAADRVSLMGRTAYREGAATLASVLEAERNARDVRTQYLIDLAGAWIARGVVRLLSESTTPGTP